MTKIDVLRRCILPCFSTGTAADSATATPISTTKKRLSTSLRDDHPQDHPENDEDSTTTDESIPANPHHQAPPRPSKTMVIGTIFGRRRGHVWFCVQHDRLSTKPSLLLELSIPTQQLVKEMRCGLVRIALECDRSDLASCPLHSVPVWTMFCNGRKLGFAIRRKPTENNRVMLKTMQSMTVGAGVIPPESGSEGDGELMYMRANYECVVGSCDSESFHLINPDDCPGQELSVFLLRTSFSSELGYFLVEMLEGKAVVRETDMSEAMQSHCLELAYRALDLHEVCDCQAIARFIKQKFDEAYGPAWHCVVGVDFGSCITHLCGNFIFFIVETMEFLVFKDGKELAETKEEAIGVVHQRAREVDT